MIKVAIIEDSASYLKVLEMLFNGAAGMTCCGTFESAERALTGLPSIKPDVAIVDIHLPEMNGIDLVRVLRDLMPETLFIICSAFHTDEEVFLGLQAGAHSYILKSTAPHLLVDAIYKLREGSSPMSNEIARKIIKTFQTKAVLQHEYDLTKREKEILQELSQGLHYKEIAVKLTISVDAVRRHCFDIYTKLHVENKVEALNKYYSAHQNK